MTTRTTNDKRRRRQTTIPRLLSASAMALSACSAVPDPVVPDPADPANPAAAEAPFPRRPDVLSGFWVQPESLGENPVVPIPNGSSSEHRHMHGMTMKEGE
jgi:hypothetical protein